MDSGSSRSDLGARLAGDVGTASAADQDTAVMLNA